jgi:hypothetical protein
VDEDQLTMRPMPRSEPPPQITFDRSALRQTKSWQPTIQPTDEEIASNLKPLDDLVSTSQPSPPPESTVVEEGETELSAEDLQGIIGDEKAEAEASSKPQPADEPDPKPPSPAEGGLKKPEEPCLFTLDKPQASLDTSAVDAAAKSKVECLAKLREVYGEKATEGFSRADPEVLQDAVTMLVQGEWITDDARLRNLLYPALPALDYEHFKPDDSTIKLTETRTLCRALISALNRNFEDNERVKPIAKKLQETNPYIRSDGKSSSGASPLPGKFSALVASPKKRHKGA